MRDSEKGLGFLMGHEAPETKAQRIKEMGERIKRMTRHSYKDIPISYDPINLDTPVFTPTPTVASKKTPKTKPTPIEKYRVTMKQLTKPKATPLQMKQLHQRLENHNERTGQFKNLPKEEEHPYIKGHMEDLQRIEDKGKSWLVKHLKKENQRKNESRNKINQGGKHG